jgi:hypothetical protein
MLCFVMALKSPAVAANWETAEAVFDRTLTSVCNQDDPDFRVIVVCNQIPRLAGPAPPVVHFVVKDLPVPGPASTMTDKWTKLAYGLVAARELHPDFVMLMDADDLVSRRLSGFVKKNNSSYGWIFKKGYYWRYGSRWIQWTEHFNCGTNSIVSSQVIRFPKQVRSEEIDDCLILRNGHTIIERAMRDNGTPLDPLPFAGAVWVHGHGENYTLMHSNLGQTNWHRLRFFLGSLPQRRFVSRSLKKEFCL